MAPRVLARDAQVMTFDEIMAAALRWATGAQPTARQCGPCSACCHNLAVAELAKPSETWCAHCTKPGCGIYAERPETCRGYACAWLLGFGDEVHRPDRSGIIVDFYAAGRACVVRITRWTHHRRVPPTFLPWIKTLVQDVSERAAAGDPLALKLSLGGAAHAPIMTWSPEVTAALQEHGDLPT